MNLRTRENLRLSMGVAVSVIIHAAFFLPWFMAALQPRDAASAAEDSSPAAELQEMVQLGVDESSASTMAWIGYEEYEEHLAQLSEQDQAAMTDAPPPGAEPMQAAPPEIVAVPSDTPPPPRAIVDAEVQTPPSPNLMIEPSPIEASPNQPLIYLPEEIAESETSAPSELETKELSTEAQPDEFTDQEDGDRPITEVDAPAEITADGEKSDPRDVPPGEQTPPPDTTGDVTDREADPTSIVKVPPDKWKTGKPLSAQGMELKPQKPVFTTLVQVTAAPRKSVFCELDFDHRGVVTDARLVKGSGDSRIDISIYASLFGWRARGKPIDALKGTDDVVTVPMQIILMD